MDAARALRIYGLPTIRVTITGGFYLFAKTRMLAKDLFP